MREEITTDHFISAIEMGEKIFELYLEKSQTDSMRELIYRIIQMFQNEKIRLQEKIEQKDCQKDLSFFQKNAIFMEKIKMSRGKKDFDLSLTMIKSLQAARVGTMKYLKKCDLSKQDTLKQEVRNTFNMYHRAIEEIENYVIEVCY